MKPLYKGSFLKCFISSLIVGAFLYLIGLLSLVLSPSSHNLFIAPYVTHYAAIQLLEIGFFFIIFSTVVAVFIFFLSKKHLLKTYHLVFLSFLVYCWVGLGGVWYYPSALQKFFLIRDIPLYIFFSLVYLMLLIGLGFVGKWIGWKKNILFIGLLFSLNAIIYYEPDSFAFPNNPNKHQNIFLIGFDAVNYSSVQDVFQKKTFSVPGAIFEKAYTPIPVTDPAWFSVLTGQNPDEHNVRYPLDFNRNDKNLDLLPKYLQKKGFSTYYAGDSTETSHFDQHQGIDHLLTKEVGWKYSIKVGLWNRFIYPAFILNNAFLDRWFDININHSGLFRYNQKRFFNKMFYRLAKEQSPYFMAAHTCFLHAPIYPGRRSFKQINYNYLKLKPSEFSNDIKLFPKLRMGNNNWVNPYEFRLNKFKVNLELLLEELKHKNYFANNIVVLFSDHGEVFYPGFYTGIHGPSVKELDVVNVLLAVFTPTLTQSQLIDKPTSIKEIRNIITNLIERPTEFLNKIDHGVYMESAGTPYEMTQIDGLFEPNQPFILETELSEEKLIFDSDGSIYAPQNFRAQIIQSKTYRFDFDNQPVVVQKKL